MKVSQEKKVEKAFNIGIRIVGILGGIAILFFGVQAVNKAVRDAHAPKPTVTPVAEVSLPPFVPSSTPVPAAVMTNTPVPTVVATATPTYVPDDMGRIAELATPTPLPIKAPFLKATTVQNDIVPNILYTLEGSTNVVLGNSLTFNNEGFCNLVKKLQTDRCPQIPLSDVGVGDIAYEDGAAAICVGFYGEHPMFAYFGNENYANEEYNIPFGVFVGYAASDKDELFCGCAPIDIDTFYDSGYGKGDNSTFLWWVSEYFKAYDYAQFNTIYEFGRALSTADGKKVRDMLYEEELKREGLVWTAGYPEIFCKLFESYAGGDGYENYSLIPTSCYEYENYGRACYEYSCEILSLKPETFLKKSGSWNIVLVQFDDGFKVMPHSRFESITGLMSKLGLAPESETVVAVDENGNEYTVYKDTEYGFTTDEDGRIIFRSSDGTVMGGFEEGSEYALATGGNSSGVYDILEKSGWIIDRTRNAYYEGDYFEYDGVRYYGDGVWYDIDTNEKVGIEVDGCYDWWYYMIGDVVYLYYYKEETADGKTKYFGDTQYCITEDGRMYYMLWDVLKNDYSWYLYDDNTYEVVLEANDYWINCVTTGQKYLFRLVPEGEEKEMWLMAGHN